MKFLMSFECFRAKITILSSKNKLLSVLVSFYAIIPCIAIRTWCSISLGLSIVFSEGHFRREVEKEVVVEYA